MGQPIEVRCELCGSQATLAMNSYTDAAGAAIEWPKAQVKDDGIYFTVACPMCGDHEQLMAEPSDTQ